MIYHSFIFLEKVSSKTEQKIWQQGLTDWNLFLRAKTVRGFSQKRKYYYNRKLEEAKQQLKKENSAYFSQIFPKKEIWRLYNYFKEEACYLDIEIDSWGKIILVGISDDYQTKTFIRGINLDKKMVERELVKYKLLITFNGAAFDLPKLKKQLKLEIKIPHLDLKPLCVNLGLKGGLKKAEEKLNLGRPSHLKGNPVGLWKAFQASGDREWLELLVDYNKEDVENLKKVADFVYEKLSSEKVNYLSPK